MVGEHRFIGFRHERFTPVLLLLLSLFLLLFLLLLFFPTPDTTHLSRFISGFSAVNFLSSSFFSSGECLQRSGDDQHLPETGPNSGHHFLLSQYYPTIVGYPTIMGYVL